MSNNNPIIEVKNLVKDFPINANALKKSHMRALNDVSFNLYKGRALAIVGESGSGKSTSAKIIAKMYSRTAGTVKYHGRDIDEFNQKQSLMEYRESVQMIFQDPFGSLNPTHTIFHHLARPLLLHKKVSSKAELPERIYALLERVGLTPAKETAEKFPHQLSGGQRQRVNIARNLAVEAEIILADEPTSMLDVSIRLGVLNLMEDMKNDGISMMYITHDIATARYLAEDIGVMYVGHLVEWGEVDEVLQKPAHPYTQLLMSAVPDPEKSIHDNLEGGRKGEIPLWTPESVGCPFSGRCLQAMDKCNQALPEPKEIAPNHFVRCFLHE
ncbi:ABC transporter ATP-binding protein [Motilimonas eburnea]|uniref:ABC transporter ATP-binding protein n=1 Tax=Motilimonas eburnea TaxID=1737488 RepID=UPI001E5FD91E|nr:ABC transporter ATP-binding protein [Motilimonas eburnea]MCE2570076.1 ABC transporter ATP-binding protein [Motilimonas eburnea]